MKANIPAELFENLKSRHSSPIELAKELNKAEESYSCVAKDNRRKRFYPFWKNCEDCDKPFQTNNHTQAIRNRLCQECQHKRRTASRKKTPIEKRKITKLVCPVCQKEFYKQDCHIKKNDNHHCSRHCSSVVRGQEWAKHGYKGRSMWTEESEKGFKEKMSGVNNPAWKGGVTLRNRKGNYISYKIKYVRCPHSFIAMSRKDGYVMEHRLIVAKQIGRPLSRAEAVHHIDHNPENNDPSNLMLFRTNAEHKKFEGGDRSIVPTWTYITQSQDQPEPTQQLSLF